MLGVLRQTAIYRAGVSGRRPRVPTDATQLEARARKAMPAEAYAYIAGGRSPPRGRSPSGAGLRASPGFLSRSQRIPCRLSRSAWAALAAVMKFGPVGTTSPCAGNSPWRARSARNTIGR